MHTWLHDVEVFAALADGEPGPARDWGTTRLALAAPERFAVFPEDERCHDVVLAAGPPRAVASLSTALEARKPCPAGLANAAAALGQYGLIPADTAPLAESLRRALRRDGDAADLWLAHALATLGAADPDTLAVAARADGAGREWILPLLVLRVAEQQGALDEAAAEVAAELHRQAARNPNELFVLLVALGVPLGALAMRYGDVDEAISIGSALAHREPPTVRLSPGSARRRHQQAVRALLESVAGPAAALLRAAYREDPRPEWHLWPVAAAAWIRGTHHEDDHPKDALHSVLYHGGGGDPLALSEARRAVTAEHQRDVLTALQQHPDAPIGVLATELLRRTGDRELAAALLAAHGGDPDVDLRTAAFACVAAWHDPEAIPALLGSTDSTKRLLGLVCAEWVPTAEVLQALLQMPVPARPSLRLQYARALAAMGDPATLGHLEQLLREDEQGELALVRGLAEDLLRVKIP